MVGLASAQQVVDHPQECTGEDGVGLLLGAPTVEEALVTHAPLWGTARSHEGGQREGMAQGAWSALGQMLLPAEGAALARTRIQAGVRDDLVDAAKPRDIPQLRTARSSPLRPNAGKGLQLLALDIVTQEVGNRRFHLRDVRREFQQLLCQRAGDDAAR